MRPALALLIFATVASAAPPARAGSCGQVPEVLVVLDRSGSMKETIAGQSKWSLARTAVNSLVSRFSGQLAFGLMLFSRWPHVSHCTTGQVNVDPGIQTASRISSLLQSVYPSGDTPSTNSLDAARSYLRSRSTSKPQVVILLTDGKETCSPYWPNTATAKLLADGVKTYVIGFGSGVSAKSLQDAARDGGTGSYYQANDLAQLNKALRSVAGKISCCGNGTLDTGEKCDTGILAGLPGACPQTCDDHNTCTVDSVSGTGCNATCVHTNTCPVTTCGNRKLDSGERCDTGIARGLAGACPSHPSDCDDKKANTKDFIAGSGCQAYCAHTTVSTCGNGQLDPGELCDTAIGANTKGTCRVSCADDKKCTLDVKRGSGCLTYCAHTPITRAKSGDGCCPPGASSLTDSDCQAACGNGKLDRGETCDPKIKSGKGSCSVLSCNDRDACTVDKLGGSACNPSCVHEKRGPSTARKDGCCPAGLTLNEDADCKPVCGPDKPKECVDPCRGVKCGDGRYCKPGKGCVAWPKSDGKEETAAGDRRRSSNTDRRAWVGGCGAAPGPGGGGPIALALLGLGLGLAVRRRRRRS